MGRKIKSQLTESNHEAAERVQLTSDENQLSNLHNKKAKRTVNYWQIYVCIGFLLLFLIIFSFKLKWLPMFIVQNGEWEVETLRLFAEYDENKDDYLSLAEFAALLRSEKVQIKPPSKVDDYQLHVEPFDQMTTIQAFFTPLDRSTMTKDIRSGSTSALQGLFKWTQPSKHWCNFAVGHFVPAFLPPSHQQRVGHAWTLIYSSLSMFVNQLSSNRYYPPRIDGHEIIFHQLLHLFHPYPFIYTRFAPQGAMAVVRAENDDLLDIVYRIHAEFQLNVPPLFPFWFTPAQLTGNLIITKDGSKLHFFQMYVPNEKKLNVDMEWLNGPGENENMEVDIGFLPLMKLNSSSPSVSASFMLPNGSMHYLNETFVHGPDNYENHINSIKWKKEISYKDAKDILQHEMYPFTQVEYLSYEAAFFRAKHEKKLVHSILLWGALDDQSC